MQTEGKLVSIIETKTGEKNGKAWSLVVFIIETFGEYPKKQKLQSFKPLDCGVGSMLKIDFNLESKAYNDKAGVERWDTTATAYKVEIISAVASTPTAAPQIVEAEPIPNEDDLPF